MMDTKKTRELAKMKERVEDYRRKAEASATRLDVALERLESTFKVTLEEAEGLISSLNTSVDKLEEAFDVELERIRKEVEKHEPS